MSEMSDAMHVRDVISLASKSRIHPDSFIEGVYWCLREVEKGRIKVRICGEKHDDETGEIG